MRSLRTGEDLQDVGSSSWSSSSSPSLLPPLFTLLALLGQKENRIDICNPHRNPWSTKPPWINAWSTSIPVCVPNVSILHITHSLIQPKPQGLTCSPQKAWQLHSYSTAQLNGLLATHPVTLVRDGVSRRNATVVCLCKWRRERHASRSPQDPSMELIQQMWHSHKLVLWNKQDIFLRHIPQKF